MGKYIKEVDLLDACVEVEYLGLPRMMISAAKISQLPSIELVRCVECEYCDTDYSAPPHAHHYCSKWARYTIANGSCSIGKEESE